MYLRSDLGEFYLAFLLIYGQILKRCGLLDALSVFHAKIEGMDTFLLMAAVHFVRAKLLEKYPRKIVRSYQERVLRETLLHAWDSSPFYRELWSKAGITREQLPTIPLDALPVVTKRDLMPVFPQVVTVAGITQKEVEAFIQSDPTGKEWFRDSYVAMNTSG